MPTYEYECQDCNCRFERRQRFTEEPITVCPECGGSTHRVPCAVGIIFKGAGFYCTDNRGNGNGGGSRSEPSSATAEGKEEKPAAKSDDKVADKPAGDAASKAPEKSSEKGKEKATAGSAAAS
jgi:putative FmdB family regulatory protein